MKREKTEDTSRQTKKKIDIGFDRQTSQTAVGNANLK